MAAISGKTTVTTAGTAVALGSQDLYGASLFIRALSGNNGVVYIGNDGAGDVASTNGYEMNASDEVLISKVLNLGQIWVDAAQNGEGVTWLVVEISKVL